MSCRTVGIVAVFVLLCGLCSAYGDVTWSPTDFPSANPPLDGSPLGYGYPCEIFNASAVYEDTGHMLHIVVNTNFPANGLGGAYGGYYWRDSYGVTSNSNVVFNAGDLYVAYAPSGDWWNPSKLFAVGVSAHSGNIVPQAYNGGTWKPVAKGGIYRTANDRLTDFATGTYEGYEHTIPGGTPADAGNGLAEEGLKPQVYETGYPNHNTYPTLLRNYSELLGQATVAWADVDVSRWPGCTRNQLGARDLMIDLDPTALGISASDYDDLHFFWSMECGNDGVLLTGAVGQIVPEPFSIALFSTVFLGALGYNIRRRK